MKSKSGREIALLSLPVLALLGVALLRGSNGTSLLSRLNAAKLLDSGPKRIEFSPFQPVEIKPLEAAEGFDWAVTTNLTLRGSWEVPPGWTEGPPSEVNLRDMHLVYRRGSVWREVPPPTGKSSRLEWVAGANQSVTLRVNLETVPRDAVEVRARGKFQRIICYRGPIPRGWKPPKGLTIAGLNRILEVTSEPFDLQIVAPGEPFPTPAASRESPLSFVRAYSQVTSLGGSVYIQLHRDPQYGPPDDNGRGPDLVSFSILDGKGKTLDLCSVPAYSPGSSSVMKGVVNRESLSPDFPATDILVRLMEAQEPCGGWARYKGPFTLETEFSEDGTWPVKVRVPIQFGRAIGNNEFPFRGARVPH